MRTALLYNAHRCLAVGPNFGVHSGTSTLKHVLAKMDWGANHREAVLAIYFLPAWRFTRQTSAFQV